MGASDGGLEAFQSFFAHMPADAGIAFVVVTHVDPDHGASVPEQIARHTQMPVTLASDGLPVEPDHIYVTPPDAALTIDGGKLRVRVPVDRPGPRAPIDGFFHSLAQDQGEWAVSMLLSTKGTDGTLGVRAVREHGGMAVARTAGSVPQDVDHVARAEDMPARLLGYVARLGARNGTAGRDELAEQLASVRVLLRRTTGHDFAHHSSETLVRRIQRRVRVLQVPSVAEYVERLRDDPREADQLSRDVLIGVTDFFRDPRAFEALNTDVIPSILTSAEHSIRVWVPGCATGEEAYSIAILLREALCARRDLRVQIFASDIHHQALAFARRAVYPEGIADQVTPLRLERFFDQRDHTYALVKEIREMCTFSTHDLAKDPPFSRLDLIVGRNPLLQLEPRMQRHVAGIFHYALRAGGTLFLGASGPFTGATDLFHTVDETHGIFRRNEIATRPPLMVPPPAPSPRVPGVPAAPGSRVASPPARETPDRAQALERILLQHYSPAWVVVDAHGDVVYFSPRTGRYLEPAAGVPSTRLVDMARKDIQLDLRTTLHRALRTGEQATCEELKLEADGRTQRIGLTVQPLRDLDEWSGLYMVVFRELAPPTGSPDAAEKPSDTQELETELRATQEHLLAAVEELETANEELLTSNEELLSANEELQTSKDGMQTINDELATLNAELASKVEQLDGAHGDLQNLFESTQIASIFLDRDLHIKKFTPAAMDVFRLIETDIGRSIADITPRFSDPDLFTAIRSVLRTLGTQERHVQLMDGSTTYVARILPYRGVDDVIHGVVLTFVDVTALTRAQARQAELAAIVESSLDAIVADSPDGTITIWNASAARMFGYTPQEAVGRPVSLIVPAERQAESERVHERLASGELVEPFESVRVTREGLRLPVSVAVSAIRDASGAISGSSASYRNLADTQRARQELLSEVRNRDQFLAMLGHELRGPLSPLRMCLEVLRSPAAGELQAGKAKEMMERQLAHLTALVDQLLDASRISKGKISLDMRMVDLVQLVRVVAEDHRGSIESRGLVLNVELPSGPLWVHGDSVRLTQAVGNLLHNAGKFTEIGTVTVRLAADKRGTQAAVTVRDSGIGMDQNMLGELFKPFSQADQTLDRSKGGLGLGLSLTRGLIEAHQGTVEAHSLGLGRGSTFTLRLPTIQGVRIGRDAAAAEARSGANGDEPGQSRRILVIEDSPDAAESLGHVLELMGNEVVVAPDGQAALGLARRFKPEIVICDIGLPGEMNGYAVAAAFRADPEMRDIHLVALTGYGREEDARRALQAGFELHLRKPADIQSLRGALAGLVRTGQ